jgi:predicted transport protein
MIKKENHRLTPISAIKIIDFYVAFFMRKVFLCVILSSKYLKR